METVVIEKMDHQGRGIGKVNEKIIFVPYTLVGEIVEVKVLQERSKFLVGQVLKIVKSSPKRVLPECPYYLECGGCNLLHTSYAEQLIIKEHMIKDIFNRYFNDLVNFEKIIASDVKHYRNKMTFQVKNYIGLYKKNTNEVVAIDSCLIASPKINEVLLKIKEEPLDNIDQIIIRSNQDDESLILLKAHGPIKINKLGTENIVDVFKNSSFKLVSGKDHLLIKMNDFNFYVSSNSFFQVNTKQAIKLYDTILAVGDFNKNDRVLDLYCGTGTIGIYISKYVKSVLGVEINKDAIADANKNKALNDIKNVSFICNDISKVIVNKQVKPDVIIIDPPRSGLLQSSVIDLINLKATKIIYVSCNPITLVRDLNLLRSDYNIDLVVPIDMFPNTSHIECVCLLTRNK